MRPTQRSPPPVFGGIVIANPTLERYTRIDTIVRGPARFVASHAVAVGDTVLEAEHIVSATGSKPRPLPGAEHLITSEQVAQRARALR